MPGPRPKYAITLTPEQEARLQQLSTCYMAPFATVQRAQILLLAHCHPEWQNATIAQQVGCQVTAIPGRKGPGERATKRKGRAAPRAEDRTHFRGWRTRARTESDSQQRLGYGGRQATVQAIKRLCARAGEHHEGGVSGGGRHYGLASASSR
jgi:hypothetical protein